MPKIAQSSTITLQITHNPMSNAVKTQRKRRALIYLNPAFLLLAG